MKEGGKRLNKEAPRDGSGDEGGVPWGGLSMLWLALKTEAWGHELRNVDGPERLGESREWIFPCSLQKDHGPIDTLP